MYEKVSVVSSWTGDSTWTNSHGTELKTYFVDICTGEGDNKPTKVRIDKGSSFAGFNVGDNLFLERKQDKEGGALTFKSAKGNVFPWYSDKTHEAEKKGMTPGPKGFKNAGSAVREDLFSKLGINTSDDLMGILVEQKVRAFQRTREIAERAGIDSLDAFQLAIHCSGETGYTVFRAAQDNQVTLVSSAQPAETQDDEPPAPDDSDLPY